MTVLADTFNRHAARANQIVDTSFYRYRESDDFLLQYFPVEEIRNWTYLSQFMKGQMPIASVVGLDSELPSIPRQMELTEALQRYAKVGITHPYGEREIRQYLDATDRRDPQAIRDFFQMVLFGPVSSLADSAIDRVKMLTWQLISTLQVDYEDPLTEVKLQVDFRSLGHAENFPAALTGADAWNQPTTATGLTDIRDHLRTYRDKTGTYPDEIAMSDTLIYYLLAQDSTRSEMMGMRGMLPDSQQLTNVTLFEQQLDSLNQALRRLVLEGTGPTIRPFNKFYAQLNKNDTITDIPFLSTDTYVFLKRVPTTPGQATGLRARRMGAMVFGPTVESATAGRPPTSIEQIRSRMRTGPHTWAREISDSPVHDEACCVANAIPVPGDPRFFGARKVI